VGDKALVAEQQTRGRFSDGKEHEYGLGLYIRPYRGVLEVGHSGSTAGYRAYLARYPERHVSVAVLCNAGNANATQFAHAVAELYLGDRLTAPATTSPGSRAATPASLVLTPAKLSEYTGRYVSDEAETEFTVVVDRDVLVLKRRPDTALRMRPSAPDTFAVPSLGTVTFHRQGQQVTSLSVKLDRVWDLKLVRFPQ